MDPIEDLLNKKNQQISDAYDEGYAKGLRDGLERAAAVAAMTAIVGGTEKRIRKLMVLRS